MEYHSDKKYREIRVDVKKKEKELTDANFAGSCYVDASRNIAVAAGGEADLGKDLEESGLGKGVAVAGPSPDMFHRLAKYQIKLVQSSFLFWKCRDMDVILLLVDAGRTNSPVPLPP